MDIKEYDDEDVEFGRYDFKDIKEIMREEGLYEVTTKDHKHYLVSGFKYRPFGYYFYERIGDKIHFLLTLDYEKVIDIRKVK